MNDDIVTRLREYEAITDNAYVINALVAAADEIERLRRWASYEHAGYCGCAGGDQECVERAYTRWKKMFNE